MVITEPTLMALETTLMVSDVILADEESPKEVLVANPQEVEKTILADLLPEAENIADPLYEIGSDRGSNNIPLPLPQISLPAPISNPPTVVPPIVTAVPLSANF